MNFRFTNVRFIRFPVSYKNSSNSISDVFPLAFLSYSLQDAVGVEKDCIHAGLFKIGEFKPSGQRPTRTK